MSGISRDAWLAALNEAIEPPDPDALTTMDFARLFGLCRGAASARLERLVGEGKAQRTRKRIRRGDGYEMTVAAYRLVTPKGKRG